MNKRKPNSLSMTAAVFLAFAIQLQPGAAAYGGVEAKGAAEETTVRFPVEEESREVETELRGTPDEEESPGELAGKICAGDVSGFFETEHDLYAGLCRRDRG